MAKLSTGNKKSKHFDFTLEDNDFEVDTWRFVPVATAANSRNLYEIKQSEVHKIFENWKREQNSLFSVDKVPESESQLRK